MITDEQYELCRPILENDGIEEEEKIERLEDTLSRQASLRGAVLENTILDALWRHRSAAKGEGTPLRHTVIRKQSPAPWQTNRSPTPLASTPPSASSVLSSGFSSRPSFSRQKSTASPFVSPRASPRLALAQPIPHSPNLNAYEFSVPSPAPDIYGDYGSDTVDWLVGDDTASNASSTGTGTLSAAAPDWMPQNDMGPYDILRSVLGDKLSDAQIEKALEEHSYDFSAAIASLLGTEAVDIQHPTIAPSDTGVLVGKSTVMSQTRPVTPGSDKSAIVCKYWLASGSCLRADCRFAHDTSSHVCKYWMNGQCLAGESCQFSHDPSALMTQLTVNDSGLNAAAAPFQFQDNPDQFPALSSSLSRNGSSYNSSTGGYFPATNFVQQRARGGLTSRPQSRPSSRHQNRPEVLSSLSMDDPEAFPTLGSLSAKRNPKHHGHRSRHGNTPGEKDVPSSLADVVRMSPSPAPAQLRKPETARKIRPSGISSTSAQKIPEPQHIPWLETGSRANQQYLRYRQEAIKHGSIRNKFLQSAAQAWNRNDARAAKALSLRGQAENDAMRKAHRDAARALYEERNQHLAQSGPGRDEHDEVYIDLHGLHPEYAIEYLEEILVEHAKRGHRVVYAITGTGHHSKNGKDKVGKGVRGWLNEWGYTYREFSVPGERGGYVGGVLGIDCSSHRKHASMHHEDDAVPVLAAIPGKIQLLRRE